MPWKPGESGNPKGRPRRGNALSDILREHLAGDERYGEGLMLKLLTMGLHGNLAAIGMILDRLEGRAAQPLHIAGSEEPIVVRMPLAGPPDDTVGMYPRDPDDDDDPARPKRSPVAVPAAKPRRKRAAKKGK